ncbi:MAG TPA: hypothetical protein VNA57_02655 [Acidimicrobiales bacterium]|nr:hypothetical protein [Acidimicrobiales bacterium]
MADETTRVLKLRRALPSLYLEGLKQRALLGQEQVTVYKLGLIEAILRDTLRGSSEEEPELRTAMEAAIEVARWEMPSSRGG